MLGDAHGRAGAGAGGGQARHARPGWRCCWSEDGHAASVTSARRCSTGAGWRVAVVPDAARLPVAWQELNRAGAPAGRQVRRGRRGRQARRPSHGLLDRRRPRAGRPGEERRMGSHRRTLAAAVAAVLARRCRSTPSSSGASGSWPDSARSAWWRWPGRRPGCAGCRVAVLPGRRPGRAAALPQPGVLEQPGHCCTCCRRPPRSLRSAHLAGPGVHRRRQVRSPGARAARHGAARAPAASGSRPCSPT